MNAVLFASKSRNKTYVEEMKDAIDFRFVGWYPVIRGNSTSGISDLNPHMIVIDHSVKFKDIELLDFIILIRNKFPEIRIIYSFPNEVDFEDNDFLNLLDNLTTKRVYDVIIPGFKIKDVIEQPLKLGEVREKIEEEKNRYKKIEISENKENDDEVKQENIKIDMDHFALSDKGFDIRKITKIIDEGEVRRKGSVQIALYELQHHNGCTHTAFELAQYLKEQNSEPCIVMLDKYTYESLLMYYHIKTSSGAEGVSMKGIHIFPETELEKVRESYTHIILDVGYMRKQNEIMISQSDLKIMLCSASEWDMYPVSNFLNYNETMNVRDICYLFLTSRKRFLKLNKAIMKGGYSSYRLDMSDSCYSPCENNTKVYKELLKRFILSEKKKKKVKKLVEV